MRGRVCGPVRLRERVHVFGSPVVRVPSAAVPDRVLCTGPDRTAAPRPFPRSVAPRCRPTTRPRAGARRGPRAPEGDAGAGSGVPLVRQNAVMTCLTRV
ncbi:hypothetical protein GCM10010420_24680 [Streptomyces glaucosporus]|uniref:Uncharacterized protein n=1 Tax=Streptomyces glaucosporus TaxID=284044 RepID=A0ABP5VA39_9ACTN